MALQRKDYPTIDALGIYDNLQKRGFNAEEAKGIADSFKLFQDDPGSDVAVCAAVALEIQQLLNDK